VIAPGRATEPAVDGANRKHIELGRLLEEQAALRRVATLVAPGVPPTEVFAAIAEEAGRLLGADNVALARFEPDGAATVLAGLGEDEGKIPAGTPWEADDLSPLTAVWRTGRAARVDQDHCTNSSVPTADNPRRMGIRSAAASPILVEGRLWGVMCVSTKHVPLPSDTEERMTNFTELVATAITNTNSRAELAASRVRIVTAADQARRRIERDLHEGIQQRLVSLRLDLRATQATMPGQPPELQTQLARLADGLESALGELQELSHRIHPPILSEGGLGPALRALARRSTLPVDLDVDLQKRFPVPVEVAAYHAVAEALTNAAKHAHASVAHIDVRARAGRLRLSVGDDGVGGADPARGSGLIGLTDRVQALGGTITIHSPPSEGTTLLIDLPVT
jgi:signal transduction histidine kinase